MDSFCVWLLSFNIKLVRTKHVIVDTCYLLVFIVLYHFTVWMYCNVFIHPWWTFMLSSVWGYYEYVAVHFLVCVFWHTKEHISPWYILGSGVSGHRICLYSASVVVQLLSHVWLFATPWTAAPQASLSFIISQSLLKLMSILLMIPSNHFILRYPLLLLLSIFPSITVFFQGVGSLHQVAKVLGLQLPHQFFQWILVVDFL